MTLFEQICTKDKYVKYAAMLIRYSTDKNSFLKLCKSDKKS